MVGCAFIDPTHTCTLVEGGGRKEGYDSLDCHHDVAGVKYYAQPSMGVAVCPVTVDYNNTRQVAEICYYIYSWVGSWSIPEKRFDR
jgi:hypothetical protein